MTFPEIFDAVDRVMRAQCAHAQENPMKNSRPNRQALHDMACAILRSTSDGDSLAPFHLRLVEAAVNNLLNEKGEELFVALHLNATKPEGYTRPWFLGIEHMTQDLDGYILWKGKKVEHFCFAQYRQGNWEERQREEAERLARICHELEEGGITPTTDSVLSKVLGL